MNMMKLPRRCITTGSTIGWVMEERMMRMSNKKDMSKWINHVFQSSTVKTLEFKEFARDFKKAIKNRLPDGSELHTYSVRHFGVFGYVKRGDKYVYFSISDVRYFQDKWWEDILVRTASNEKDYMGGRNHRTSLDTFKETVDRLLETPHERH